MKIIHYTLGIPPNRSGGLVKYVIDLASEQLKNGDVPILLYPGSINKFKNKPNIKNVKSKNIKHYELNNSLPLPIFNGIKEPIDFCTSCDIEIYESFFEKTKPDIIHVHTLMGIHEEFFLAAKKKKIKIVFTTHDYFGLAPEPNFYFDGLNYYNSNTIENWMLASSFALSTNKLRIFQFKYYFIVKKMLKVVKSKSNLKVNYVKKEITSNKFNEYEKLKTYYFNIFKKIDYFHFNSNVSKDVYKNNLDWNIIKNNSVLSISNSNIKNKNIQISNKINSNKIKIGYIGPYKQYKGYDFFNMLSKKMDNKKYEFHIFGDDLKENEKLLINHGRYKSDDLEEIYKKIDVLIVPSEWNETFGLITIEALENKKVVYVKENVGSKDLLPSEFIFEDINDLENKIKNYFENNEKQSINIELTTFGEHCNKIKEIYYEVY